METFVSKFKPLTSERRIEDIVLPKVITLGGLLLDVPESLLRKDVHFLLDSNGNPTRAAWISPPLAHTFNSMRFENPEVKSKELERALLATDEYISNLIKHGILKDKHGPGAMAFCQANENVPKDVILISPRSYDTLCAKNPKWKYVQTVMAIRFPNLGPGTTTELRIIVNKEQGIDRLKPLTENSLGFRCEGLKELLAAFEHEEDLIVTDDSGIVDAFYIHPETLKNSFEGDGDGDQIFIVMEKKGRTSFEKINLTREPDFIPQDQIDMLFSKSERIERTNLTVWLANYFDDVPIGQATYVIRWLLYNKLREFKDSEHPMAAAWEVLAPYAINLVEFVMDVRKGDFTEEEIDRRMKNIQNKMDEIRAAQEAGNWFAKSVTANKIMDIPGFIREFRNLQTYVNLITGQNTMRAKILE